LAQATGRTQADIIREAIETTTAEASRPPSRRFRSAGLGHGGGAPVADHADEIVRRELGRSPR
jgi:hypothetical protein